MDSKSALICLVVGTSVSALACGGDDGEGPDKDRTSVSSAGDGLKGTVSLVVHAGDSVAGLNLVDGWSLHYDKFLATAGGFRAYSSADSLRDDNTHVLDMLAVLQSKTGGLLLQSFPDIHVAQFDSFVLAMPTGRSVTQWNTTTADKELMRQKGYSLYVEGSITSAAGKSCTPGSPKDCAPAPKVSFRWGIPVGTNYMGCEGFMVEADAQTEVSWTITGDRWLRTGFSPNAETGPLRAQWIADADLDRNGETTLDELKKIDAAVLLPPALYDLTGASLPIKTAYDFLVAQVHAMGLDSANGCQTALTTA